MNAQKKPVEIGKRENVPQFPIGQSLSIRGPSREPVASGRSGARHESGALAPPQADLLIAPETIRRR